MFGEYSPRTSHERNLEMTTSIGSGVVIDQTGEERIEDIGPDSYEGAPLVAIIEEDRLLVLIDQEAEGLPLPLAELLDLVESECSKTDEPNLTPDGWLTYERSLRGDEDSGLLHELAEAYCHGEDPGLGDELTDEVLARYGE